MELIIDTDVKAVAEFIQGSMPTNKLVSVASAIAALAPILWGDFEAEDIAALRLIAAPLSADRDLQLPQDARLRRPDLSDAGDGSAAAAS